MEIPALKGIIKRRILVNYRADPATVQSKLPAPFRPKLHNGHAIIGVCLIRLEEMRPTSFPLPLGVSSENAAHRFAVLWDDANGQTREGVFIPRRDTGSALNQIIGDRLFPIEHHRATFDIKETETDIDFAMHSDDGNVNIRVVGKVAPELPPTSCFASLAEASAFFETGCLGYSVRCNSPHLDGLLLKPAAWHVEALAVTEAHSSHYSDETQFPPNTVTFDHALLMRNIPHEWHTVPEPTALVQ